MTDSQGVVRLADNVYEGMWRGEPRDRFTATHEGIHGIVHVPATKELLCQVRSGEEPVLYRRAQIPAYHDPEWQASRIASAVLMPFATVQRLVERYGRDAIRLSTAYLVSIRAAELRIEQLDRIRWLK